MCYLERSPHSPIPRKNYKELIAKINTSTRIQTWTSLNIICLILQIVFNFTNWPFNLCVRHRKRVPETSEGI